MLDVNYVNKIGLIELNEFILSQEYFKHFELIT